MRAPSIEQSPFAPLQLAPGDCERLEQLAHELLRHALDEFDRFGAPSQRVLPKGVWKPVKSHENCTVFAKSSKAVAPAALTPFDPYNMFGSSDGSTSTADDERDTIPPLRNAPDLMLSGTVPGTLDDVLYGMSACDSADMMLRTAYVDDSLLDGAVLLQLQLPTPRQPFRFLGIKWAVRDIPAAAYRKPTPRDFVYLEATGVATRRDGSRVGYVVRHPLELAACPELTHRNMHRGRLAMTAIYTPLPNNAVDIFARGQVQLGGNKPSPSVAQTVTAAALLGSASAVVCAHSKKLAWLLREQLCRGGADPAVPVVRANMFACGMCTKKFGKLSSVGTCHICCVQMCSRCRMARTLSYAGTDASDTSGDLQLEHVAGTFCKNCIAFANQSNAFEVASAEVRRGRYGPVLGTDDGSDTCPAPTPNRTNSSTAGRPALAPLEPRQHATATTTAQGPPAPSAPSAPVTRLLSRPAARSYKSDTLSSFSAPVSFDSSRSTDLSRGSRTSSFCSSEDCEAFDEADEVSGDAIGVDNSSEFHEWTDASVTTVALPTRSAHAPQVQQYDPQPTYAGARSHERQELWRKMAELRLQAESVYQLTKKNSSMHLSHSNGVEVYDSDVEALD